MQVWANLHLQALDESVWPSSISLQATRGYVSLGNWHTNKTVGKRGFAYKGKQCTGCLVCNQSQPVANSFPQASLATAIVFLAALKD